MISVESYDKMIVVSSFLIIFTFSILTVAYADAPNYGSFNIPHLNLPEGVAVDGAGNIYVSDSGNNAIEKYDQSGNSLFAIGAMGSKPNQFLNPRGITVDTSGNIYVADTNNDRIQIFSPQGEVRVVKISEKGSTDIPYHPQAIAVDNSGDIYVTDSFNSHVWKITSSNNIFAIGNGSMTHDPEGVAIDQFGNVYVSDAGLNTITKFDPSGSVLNVITSTFLSKPEGLFVDKYGNIFVANTGGNDILIFDNSGNLVMHSVSGSSLCNPFNGPESIAVDSLGNVYIADTHDYTVVKIGIQDIDSYLNEKTTLQSSYCIQKEVGSHALDPYLQGLPSAHTSTQSSVTIPEFGSASGLAITVGVISVLLVMQISLKRNVSGI